MNIQVYTLQAAHEDNCVETLIDVYASHEAAVADATQYAQDLFDEIIKSFDGCDNDEGEDFDIRTYITDDYTLVAIVRQSQEPLEPRLIDEQDDDIVAVEWWRVRGTAIKGSEDLTRFFCMI